MDNAASKDTQSLPSPSIWRSSLKTSPFKNFWMRWSGVEWSGVEWSKLKNQYFAIFHPQGSGRPKQKM